MIEWLLGKFSVPSRIFLDGVAEKALIGSNYRMIPCTSLTIHIKNGSANEVVVEKAPTIANVDGAEEGRRGVEKAGGFSRRPSGASESMVVTR
jgi:hypothetical protein